MSGNDAFDKDEVLVVADLAKELHYSDRYIRDLLNRGRIKGNKLNERGQWRVLRSELNRFKKEIGLSGKAGLEQTIELESKEQQLPTQKQKQTDPLVQEAQRKHLDEIRNLIQEWRTTLRTPKKIESLLHLNKLWAQGIPTHGLENNRLFECVREHLPFSTLWQDYPDWVKKYLDFLDKNRSLVKQFRDELLKCEGVLGLGEGYAEPLILRISHRVPWRIPKIEKEFCPKGTREFCIRDCEILWDGDWRILYADDALACGKLYKAVSDRLFDSEGLRIRIILRELRLLESKIRTSLQEILIKHDYINYTCRLCPGQARQPG